MASVSFGRYAKSKGHLFVCGLFPATPAEAAPARPELAALWEDHDKHYTRLELPVSDPLSYSRCLRKRNFTATSLGYVADCWPYVVEAQRPTRLEAEEQRRRGKSVPLAPDLRLWCPTIILSLEAKKALPDEGLESRQQRIHSKQIRNGKLDPEVVVPDEHGDLVVVSSHVNLILSSEGSTSGRSTNGRSGGEVKELLGRF
ncbi:hypothetical protein VTH06DRAFT_2821 [Thermothelomyces fergusii]